MTTRLEELQAALLVAENNRQKIEIQLDLSSEWRLIDNTEALQLATIALQQSEEEEYADGIAKSHYAIGTCYWQMGDYENAKTELKIGEEKAKQLKNKKQQAKCLNILGNIYRDMGEIGDALKNYLNALEIFEKLNDEHTTGVVMKNISILHFDLFDYDNALEYALRSMAILEKYEYKNRMISVYQTLGNIYFKKEDYGNASSYFYKCIELSEPNTYPHTISTSGVGKVYFMKGDIAKAKKYLQHAEQHSTDSQYFESYIISTFYLGRIALQENKLDVSIAYFKQALESAQEHQRKHDIMSVHEWLAIAYEQQENVKEAFYSLKAFEQLRTEIFAQDAVMKLRNMQVQHEIAFVKKDKEVAERTAELKQQFLANMSHEIRTPMNAIVGFSRLLQEKEHYPHQAKYLDAIQTSADNLLVIINDILDISKLEAGKIQLEKIAISPLKIVTQVLNLLKVKATEKQLYFNTEIESSVPTILMGDPTRLSQILINLAGNAIKFTEKGGVTIRVRTKNIQSNTCTLKFEVIDTGIGISESYVNNLFEKFTQAGSDTARKYGGTGLGLSISKQLVEIMQGQISVKSKMQHGTTFTVEIPFTIGKENIQETNQKENYSLEKIKLNSLKILLVEDNEFNQIVAVDTLQSIAPNIQIDIANNGKESLEKAANFLYDVILMDIQMPEMNGLQATQHIRSIFRSPYNGVKIIAMTANVMKQDIEQYFAAGMNEYISKPFQTKDLVDKIIKIVFETNTTLDPKNILQTNTKTNPSIINLTFLQNFTKNDAAKQKKYIELFLSNAPNLLQKAKLAIAAKDYETVKINAHSLKSQLNYMGVLEQHSGVLATEKASTDVALQPNLPKLILTLEKVCLQAFAELEQQLHNL